jgi:glycosyltransferase involved in cell wall biosynthesis
LALLLVKEFIEDGRNGLLCDFFSPKQIADRVDEVLNHPDRMRYLGQAARRDIVEKYEVRKKLAEYQELYLSLLG